MSNDLDAHVQELLPPKSTLVKSETLRTAAWTRAARIIVSLEDGMEPSEDGKYEAEMETLISHSIPNLLGPLQTEGRTIKPSLVHGDLWEENCGTDLETGQAKVFDPAAFYAHNEYEFGMSRSENVPFGRPHYRQYFRHIPPSEPKDQWDDRNKLYSMKFEITCSTLWPAVHEGQRKIITGNATDLNNKYADDSVT